MPVVVDPLHYTAASTSIGCDLAGGLEHAYKKLTHTLSTTGEMAGTDSKGQAWASTYAIVAMEALQTIALLQQTALKVATMLERTGFNHGVAESMSTSGRHRIDVPDHIDYTSISAVTAQSGDLPSPVGGTGFSPLGWWLVHALLDLQWPDGRSDRLNAASWAWLAAANDISDLVVYVSDAISSIRQQSSPEVEDAVLVVDGLGHHLMSIASSCRQIALSCGHLATSIEKTHASIVSALETLVWMTVIDQTVGAIGAIVSLGLSELFAQTGEALEVAATAREIDLFVMLFEVEASDAVLVVSAANSELLEVRRLVLPVLRTDLATADTTATSGVALSATERAEVAAEGRLAVAAIDPATRWRSSAVLMDHYERHGADFGATSASDYAKQAADFIERAQTENLPTKIASDGTIRVYDPASNTFASYGSDGRIRTYFKPTGGAKYWNKQPGVLK